MTMPDQQSQVVSASRVVIGDLGLVPTFYEETVDGSAIIVVLRAPVGGRDVSAFRALYEARSEAGDRSYHRVRREGVEDQDRLMRFGRVLWQEAKSGAEVLATLVEQSYDEENDSKDDLFNRINEPRLSHVVSWAAGTAAQLDALLAALHASGVLSKDVVERINAVAQDADSARGWDLAKVSDLDEW
jgi:hypothetical protein